MEYTIRKMDELGFDDNKAFGNKAAYLAEAKKRGLCVQDGFCVCLKSSKKQFDFEQLRKDIHDVVGNKWDAGKIYIVRSSSQYEDRATHVFPGVFKSKRYVSTMDELITAIQECFNSTFSLYAQKYKKSMGADAEEQEFFCVLVQEQIEPEYSGVLFTTSPIQPWCFDNVYHVEMVSGHCQNMLQGKQKAHSYILKKILDVYRIQESVDPFENKNRDLEKILQQLGQQTDEIIHVFGKNLDIEWGYVDGRIVIFQIRPIYDRRKPSQEKNYRERGDNGLKADAMKKFHELDMFPKKILIVDSGKSLEKVVEELNNTTFPDSQITVRFSCKNDIGLPRYFAKNKGDAIEFIKKNYRRKWAVLVHESIQVAHSYELYLDQEKAILEHIPGMWESDVQINTDVWLFQTDVIKAYVYNGERIAKYENAEGVEYRKFLPYTKEQAFSIAKELEHYIHNIRENWLCCKGLNFHFVSDVDGNIYFLNERISPQIEFKLEKKNKVVEITSKEDIAVWDGKEDVLLKIDMKRGEEMLLEEYVPFLKASGAKVYVEFGILSHPAIMLREMGIKVFSLYSKHVEYCLNIKSESPLKTCV